MNRSGARVGMYLFLSMLAVAAIAGGLALSKRARTDAVEHACWGASAG